MVEMWPVDDYALHVRTAEWEGADFHFKILRRLILSSAEDVVDQNVDNAEVVWAFLLGFCNARPEFKRQVVECVCALMDCQSWQRAFNATPLLQEKLQELPDEVQAAFAAQHEVIMMSLSAAAIAKLRAQQVPAEDSHDQVAESIRAYKEADRLRSAMITESDGDLTSEPFAPGMVLTGNTNNALHEGIEAVMDIDSPKKWECAAVSGFAQLRRGCLHTAGDMDAFEQESVYAPAVFNFLIDFVKRNRLRVRQACEVLHLLMASPSWVGALHASPMLMERVCTELPEDAQLAFGLQHEELMKSISPTARARASDAEPSQDVSDAKRVAESMKSLRAGLKHRVHLLETVQEFYFNSEGPCAPPKGERHKDTHDADEWRTAFTPDGRTYYWNTHTRESRWTPPAKYQPAKSAPDGLTPGTPVEVFSNSKQEWCPGHIERVVNGRIVVAFRLPGMSASELGKKELPRGHKDIRILKRPSSEVKTTDKEADDAALTAVKQQFSSREEQALYDELFDRVVLANPDPNVTVQFLATSGLPRRTLKEIWQVCNSELRPRLERDEFAKCCRLIGHCQAMHGGPRQSLIEGGGHSLRVLLREECADTPPPAFPKFQVT